MSAESSCSRPTRSWPWDDIALDIRGPGSARDQVCCAVRAQAHVRDDPGQPLPAVRLTLRPPKLIFTLNTLG